jgi:hypothetical protein
MGSDFMGHGIFHIAPSGDLNLNFLLKWKVIKSDQLSCWMFDQFQD